MGRGRQIQWLLKVFPSSVVKNWFDLLSEEAAAGVQGYKEGQQLVLFLQGHFCVLIIHLSASMPFRRIASQPFLPRWVTRECITIACITCLCSLSSSALWSVGNVIFTSLMHSFPTPCINWIFYCVGRKSLSETGNLPMHNFSAVDLLQSHEDSLCPLGISPHLVLIAFFPE